RSDRRSDGRGRQLPDEARTQQAELVPGGGDQARAACGGIAPLYRLHQHTPAAASAKSRAAAAIGPARMDLADGGSLAGGAAAKARGDASRDRWPPLAYRRSGAAPDRGRAARNVAAAGRVRRRRCAVWRWRSRSRAGGERGEKRLLRRPRIVLIEDDRDIARALGIRLGALGYEVQVAHDGRSGLGIVSAMLPDVIILDIGLPDTDGLAILKRLKADSTTDSIPVIVLSAHVSDKTRTQSRLLGAYRFIEKPYEVRALIPAIREAAGDATGRSVISG